MRRLREFHILRETPITLDEWLPLVSDDAEWDRHTVRMGRTPRGMPFRLELTPGSALWKGHSYLEFVNFEFFYGEIRVSDPDEETLKKMREIAGRLGARLGNRKGDPI